MAVHCQSKLIDEAAAAQYISMSVAFLRADRCRGRTGSRTVGPPWYKFGRSIKYSIDDLDAWVAAHRIDRAARGGSG